MFRSCRANLTSKAYRGGEYSCGRSIPLRAMVVAFAGSLLICSTGWADPQPDGPAKGPNQDYPGAISLGIWVADSPGTGVLVVDVAEESPAAIAGIRAGDFILSVDDSPVEKPRNLQRALRSRRGGDHVSIELWRNGKTESVDAELAVAAGEQAVQDRVWLGVALKGAGADDDQPARPVIIQVFAGSPAEQAELEVGDRVVAVDDQAIKSTTQYWGR